MKFMLIMCSCYAECNFQCTSCSLSSTWGYLFLSAEHHVDRDVLHNKSDYQYSSMFSSNSFAV